MNKLLLILLFFISNVVHSSEIIPIYSPYSAGHSGTPIMLRIISEANASQSNYQFVLEFRPGGNQITAVKSLNANSLAIIAASFIENVESGKLNLNDYVPVHALGNACWPVIVNKKFEGEIVAGGVGFGNATHLTALALADKYKFKVRYIVFKSGNDALINMAGNNGVNLVIDRYESFESMAPINPNLRMFAASCPVRLPQQPKIKTLKELGITAPYIFNIMIAHKDMPEAKRQAISAILNSAMDQIGADEIFKLSAFRPPKYDNVSTENFYHDSFNLVKNLRQQYSEQIKEQK